MLRFSANLTALFADVPFLDRFQRAADAGFEFVEFAWPGDDLVDHVVEATEAAGVQVVLMNFDAGDMAAGDRGIAGDPSRVRQFRSNVPVAVELASRLGCRRLCALIGKRVEQATEATQMALAVDSLRMASEAAAGIGAAVLVEPVNPIDNPGIIIDRPAAALELFERVGRPNLELQLDLYHAQRTEGNLVATITRLLPRIGHFQIADSPGRGEPGTGEIRFDFVLGELDRLGYQGFVGVEYVPTTPRTEDSFGWMHVLRQSAPPSRAS